jgi:hypothetical protein
MHPTQIISYYPTYAILDQITSKGYKNANIFIDLKNCAQTLYQKYCIEELIENSHRSNFIDSSIFTSVLSYLSFHKLYAVKRKINIKFYIFLEVGHSYYHKNLSKSYKVSREIDDLYGLDSKSREEFFSIVRNNYILIEKVFNRIPNVSVIRLQNLEADFIPYFLIRNKYVDSSDETANIIYSNDHDLKQSLINEHCYIFSKANKTKKIIKKNEVISAELKEESDIPDEYLPLMMSIVGDVGDDITGVKGVAGKRFKEVFPQLKSVIGDNTDVLYENVVGNKDIFKIKSSETSNKILKSIIESEENNKTISRNLKLISFEILCRELEFPRNTEMLEKKEQILKALNTQKVKKDPIIKALELNRVFLETDDMDILYYGSDLYTPS